MPTTHFYPAVQDPILLAIEKEQIDRQDVGALLTALLSMTVGADSVREFSGRLRLVFAGYETDAREVYAIPEIRQYLSNINASFPYWFHFCDKTDDSLFVVMASLIPITQTETVAGVVKIRFVEGGVSHVIGELFQGVNELYARTGLTKEDQSAMTRQIREYVNAFF